jgi:mRNA-degrading endonuclease RelE of RelBE toxin-antitoxin system
MSLAFLVITVPKTDRLLRKLHQRHPDLKKVLEQAITTLSNDPYNRTHKHQIKKLENIPAEGDGQYRLRIGRWRFRYDIDGQTVVLLYCGLRREATYRR